MDDAVREEDGLAAGDPDWVIQQLLTKYRIDIGVLTGTMTGASIQHDPRFCSALASAYNDWLLEKWVRPYAVLQRLDQRARRRTRRPRRARSIASATIRAWSRC